MTPTRQGALAAAFTFIADQLSKWWVLKVIDLDAVGTIPVTSFFDLTMAWNKGISYSWFTMDSQWPLTIGMLAITLWLIRWLMNAQGSWQAAGLGLIIGGALGNALDRILHGAVVDFAHFFWGNFSWYIFNVADVGVVAGAAILVYLSFRAPSKA